MFSTKKGFLSFHWKKYRFKSICLPNKAFFLKRPFPKARHCIQFSFDFSSPRGSSWIYYSSLILSFISKNKNPKGQNHSHLCIFQTHPHPPLYLSSKNIAPADSARKRATRKCVWKSRKIDFVGEDNLNRLVSVMEFFCAEFFLLWQMFIGFCVRLEHFDTNLSCLQLIKNSIHHRRKKSSFTLWMTEKLSESKAQWCVPNRNSIFKLEKFRNPICSSVWLKALFSTSYWNYCGNWNWSLLFGFNTSGQRIGKWNFPLQETKFA